MIVNIFVPISREWFLERLFASLETLKCDREQTNLLVYVDGDSKLFVKARNFTAASKFKERLCIQGKNRAVSHYGIRQRRYRIAKIKNESKDLMKSGDFVFCVEDDTLVPPYALDRLLVDYSLHPHAGFIQGVQLGRWGIPYIGAWKVDDPYEPTHLTTVWPGEGLEEIDAGGFFCYLTTIDNYLSVNYEPYGENLLGPDVHFGLELRKIGLTNYIDWSINTRHRDRKGEDVYLPHTEPVVVEYNRTPSGWLQNVKKEAGNERHNRAN